MVPSRSNAGFISTLLKRFGLRTIRSAGAFNDDEVVELLDILADDLRHQHPSSYVLTQRADNRPHRFRAFRVGHGSGPTIDLVGGEREEQWGINPLQFEAHTYDSPYLLLSSRQFVSFLREHHYDPEVIYSQLVESAIDEVGKTVKEYESRLASLTTMYANLRIHMVKSVLLSHLIEQVRPAETDE